LDPWSRNWESDPILDSVETKQPPIFRWAKHFRPAPKTFEKLVIATGSVPSLFLNSHLPSKKLVGSILFPHISLAGCTLAPGVNDNTTTLFISSDAPSTLFVLCQFCVDNDDSYAWTKLLFEHVTAKRVFIFDTIDEMKIQEILDDGEVELPMLRMLKTKTAVPLNLPKNLGCSFLESPQIVCGLPAALLTHCQIYEMSAILYLSVESQTHLGSETFLGFESVFPFVTETTLKGQNYHPLIQGLKVRKTNTLFI